MDRDNLRFNVLRNALYHTARRRHFEAGNRAFNFLVIILGAAAISDLFTALNLDPRWIGASVAVIGALQLVIDFGGKARDHQMLQRAYYELLAEIERETMPALEQIAHWQAQQTTIAADEPPTLRAIDAKAYNDALDSIDTFRQDQRLRIPFHHRLLGNLIAFDGHNYKKLSEL